MRLFVSYAHVDEVRVAELGAVLRAGGFDPWWDDRLEPGDDWKAELRRRITACDAFLCMLSNDSVESEWCSWELAQAVALSKPIIPILLRAGTPLPPTVTNLQYLDASSGLHNLDVARLVGKLARLKQPYPRDTRWQDETPVGIPARFKQPLPKDYRTIAQAYLQPFTPDMCLYDWQQGPLTRLPPTNYIIGVDFGTTISSVAVYRQSISELIPNDFGEVSTPLAVAIASDGTPLIGRRALDFLLQRPDRGVLEVKRLFGHDLVKEFGGPPVLVVDGIAYTPVHLAAFILRQLREDAEAYLQSSIDKAVLAAPAYFDQSQSADLMQAARLARLKVRRVVPEPVAACMGVGWGADEDAIVLVFDLGGGTFDVSILELGDHVFEVKAVNGDTRLGGADFDRIIVDHCVRVFRETTPVDLRSDAAALMRLRDAAERAKIALSTARTATVSVPFIASAGSRTLHLDVELTRTRCNELTHALAARTLRLSRETLEEAGYSSETIDKVLVVGRATRAPSVSLALGDLFGRRLRTAPDHVVALGAALEGAVLSGYYKDSLLLSCIAHTLRVQLASGCTTPVVVRNTTIPTRATITLTVQRPEQSMLIVRIVAGESSWAERNLMLAELKVPCDARLGSQLRVELTLDIDTSSELDIIVRSVKGTALAKKSLGLRQDAEWTVLEGRQTSPQDDLLMPISGDPVQLAPFPDAKRNDPVTVERWICRAATDLVLRRVVAETLGGWLKERYAWWKELHAWLLAHPAGEVPSEFSGENVFHIFSFERELLIDVLEQRLSAESYAPAALRFDPVPG